MSLNGRKSTQQRCLDYLACTEELCAASDCLRDRVTVLQSAIWLEVAEWRELVADVLSLELRCHDLAEKTRSSR